MIKNQLQNLKISTYTDFFSISPPHSQMPKAGHTLMTQRGRHLKQKTAKNSSKHENFSSLILAPGLNVDLVRQIWVLWQISILGETFITTHLIEEKSSENFIKFEPDNKRIEIKPRNFYCGIHHVVHFADVMSSTGFRSQEKLYFITFSWFIFQKRLWTLWWNTVVALLAMALIRSSLQ